MRFIKTLITGFLAAGCLLLLLPSPVYADDYGVRLMANLGDALNDLFKDLVIGCCVSIVIVILAESVVILLISRVSFPRALLVSSLANIVSALCGLIGALWEMSISNLSYLFLWPISILLLGAIFTYLGWHFTQSRAIAITIACTLILGAIPVYLLLGRKVDYSFWIEAIMIMPFSFGVTLGSEAGIFGTLLPVEGRNRALVMANICTYALYLVGFVIPLSASWIRL